MHAKWSGMCFLHNSFFKNALECEFMLEVDMLRKQIAGKTHKNAYVVSFFYSKPYIFP